MSNLYEQSSNLSVLLPYLRTVEEAVQATILIRKSFSGEIGCMLETPFILSIPHQLNSLFDFFVVGSSDLIQLVQGTDRSRIVFESGTIDYTIQLVETFVNNISDNKLIFVTNPAFYSKLKHYPNVRLLTK